MYVSISEMLVDLSRPAPTSGFSFDCDGLTVDTQTPADAIAGLRVVRDVVVHNDFRAVEWVLRLRNEGPHDTPVLSDILPLDVTLTIDPPQSEVLLHRSLGCTSTASDFAPVDDVLYPGRTLRLAPIGGRSSNGEMPFFSVELPDDEGLFIAIGWTGQWVAEFSRTYNGSALRLRAGQETTHLALRPGEEIRTPQVMVMRWRGDPQDAHNAFRRFVLRHHTPRIDGCAPELPVAASSFFQYAEGNVANGGTEEVEIAFARRLHELDLGVELYWIDAGWFVGDWPNGVGNWFPKPEAFPNGLRPVADAVHEMGMKFLMWFEPERVVEGSWLCENHPEWLLSHAEGVQPYCPQTGLKQYLLNLGDADARKWLTDHVSGLLAEWDVDIYRHDANIDPLEFWPLADSPDRRGMTEIRHVEGLYEYWEELKRRKPGLLIENCCSGNRRFDLESIRRCVNLYRSDYIFHPEGDQCQTLGLSRFVVLHANGCRGHEDYDFRGVVGTSMLFDWALWAPDFPGEKVRGQVALYKRIRPYLVGDFYALTRYSTKMNVWAAWQYDRPDLGEGVIMAFRRPGAEMDELTLHPRGLAADATYEIEDFDAGRTWSAAGSELAAGVNVQVGSAPGSAVLVYKRIT